MKTNSVRPYPFLALALTTLCVACAHTQNEVPVATATVTAPSVSAGVAANRQVPLPYRFMRRGVEVQVNSIEFAGDKLRVSVSLTGGSTDADLRAAVLMWVKTPSGKEWAYEGWTQEGELQKKAHISVKAGARFPIEMVYQRPAGSQETVQIQFPSGKWWTSQ
jgi:hypothetical protein